MSLIQSTSSIATYGLYDLDAVDQKIIHYLRQNGREPFAKIAEEIGLPSSTVRDRTNRMIENKVLQIVALVNPGQAGRRIMASLGVKLSGGDYRVIAEEIAQIEEVTHLVICAGRYDLLLELNCKDNVDLLEIITQIQNRPHVHTVETSMYFSVVKDNLDR